MKKILLFILLATLSFSAMADDTMYCKRIILGQNEYYKVKLDGKISYFTIEKSDSTGDVTKKPCDKIAWENLALGYHSQKVNLSYNDLVTFVITGIMPKQYTYATGNDYVLVNINKPDSYITIKPIQDITSSSVYEGDTYAYFEVEKAKDSTLIGKKVVAKVLQARKSNILGSEGRLVIRPLYIDNDGDIVELLPEDIYARGLNRSNVKFWTSFTVIMLFVPGSGAQITTDKRYDVRLK